MAKARKAAAPRKSARARGKDAGFEVEEQTAPSGPPMGLETGLVFVTFVALLVALVMSQIELASAFGRGLFG